MHVAVDGPFAPIGPRPELQQAAAVSGASAEGAVGRQDQRAVTGMEE